jgi:heme-degrading monooxygenase HmoA
MDCPGLARAAAPERADDYQRHYESEVSEHLRAVEGFRGARLLRRDDGQEAMFTSITWFANLDAVRDFGGDDYELAGARAPGWQILGRCPSQPGDRDDVLDSRLAGGVAGRTY